MSRKIAIIGAGAASMAAINQILTDTEASGDETIDVYDGRNRWGGRTLTEMVGDEPVDIGAEAIENEQSQWLTLLAKSNENLTWKKALNTPTTGLYWANNKTQTPNDAGDAENELEFANNRVVDIINNQISFPEQDTAAANPQLCENPTDLLKVYMNFTSSEAIEPWIFSATDRNRFQSGSVALFPYLSTTGKRLGLGDEFASFGNYLVDQSAGRITTLWGKHITAIQASQDPGSQGFTVVDSNSQATAGYDAVLITVPVPLLSELSLPYTADQIVKTTIDGIELGHYLKIAYDWPEAVKYCTNAGDSGFWGWFADPMGQYMWQLQAFPDSEVLIASITGSYAQLRSASLEKSALLLQNQLITTFNNINPPKEYVTYSWSDHPQSKGCYSHCRAGHAENRDQFSRLYFPGLYFAGEAMSLGYYGQLDGAYETAITAAKNVISYLSTLPDE